MVLNLKFGLYNIKVVNWYKNLKDFPNHIRYNGKKWEWFSYDEIKPNEWNMFFSELAAYDPNFSKEMPSYEDMFEPSFLSPCSCGAAHSSFPFDHMRYCSRWIKW